MGQGTALGVSYSALGIARNVVDYKSALQENQTAQDNARIQMQQIDYNARMSEREAEEIDRQGRINTVRMRKNAEAVESSVISAIGKSGAAISSGSPLAVLAEAAAREEMKIQDAQYHQAQQAASARTRAANYRYQYGIAEQNYKAIRAAKPSKLSLVLGIAGTQMQSYNFANNINMKLNN
jgi:hypothetical protein